MKNVSVLPQIAPFTFGDETLNAGELASATCSITKGDTPITLAWFFNNTEIVSGDEVVVSKIGRKISTLSIESVHAIHMGEYTCVAKNAAGATNFTTFLHVKGAISINKSRCFFTNIAPLFTPKLFRKMLPLSLFFLNY